MDRRIEVETSMLAVSLGYKNETLTEFHYIKKKEPVEGSQSIENLYDIYPKPTQTSLQSWLRANKVGVEVTLNQFSGLYMAGLFVPADTQSGLQKIYGLGGHSPSYEDMMEIGLVEGLKQLKLQNEKR